MANTEYLSPDVAAEQPRVRKSLNALLSLFAGGIGGGALGALLHNEKKGREIVEAYETLEKARSIMQVHQSIPREEITYPLKHKSKIPGMCPEAVETAGRIATENQGIKRWWYTLERSGKTMYGALAGVTILAPIIEYFVSRHQLEKIEKARRSTSAKRSEVLNLSPDLLPAIVENKSFAETLDSQRQEPPAQSLTRN